MPVKLLDGVEFAGHLVLLSKTRIIFHRHPLPTVYQKVKPLPRDQNLITHGVLWSLAAVFHGSILPSHSIQHKLRSPAHVSQQAANRLESKGRIHFLLTPRKAAFISSCLLAGTAAGLWEKVEAVDWKGRGVFGLSLPLFLVVIDL